MIEAYFLSFCYITGSVVYAALLEFKSTCRFIFCLAIQVIWINANFSRFTDERYLAKRVKSSRLPSVRYDYRSAAARRSQHGSSGLRANRRSTQIYERKGIHKLPVLQRGKKQIFGCEITNLNTILLIKW